jgi:hypothetical protein
VSYCLSFVTPRPNKRLLLPATALRKYAAAIVTAGFKRIKEQRQRSRPTEVGCRRTQSDSRQIRPYS